MYIVMTPGKVTLLRFTQNTEYLSEIAQGDYGLGEKVYEQVYGKEPPRYASITTEIKEEIILRSSERDVLMYCAGCYGSVEVMSEQAYQREKDEAQANLNKGDAFRSMYAEALEGATQDDVAAS